MVVNITRVNYLRSFLMRFDIPRVPRTVVPTIRNKGPRQKIHLLRPRKVRSIFLGSQRPILPDPIRPNLRTVNRQF